MLRIRRLADPRAMALLVLIAAGCSNPDGGPAGVTGSITVAATPAALSVDQGSGSSSTVTLTRTVGFTGPVFLSVTGLPTGITATITPAQLSADATMAAITLTVAAMVPAQTYNATITASATGVATATATLALIVVSQPAGSTDVFYRYCDESENPIFFAYQDGNGAWQAVGPTAPANTFAFKLTNGFGGVMAVFPTAAGNESAGTYRVSSRSPARTLGTNHDRYSAISSRLRGSAHMSRATTFSSEIKYASARELAQDGAQTCARTMGSRTARAVVTGVGAGQYGVLSLGSSNALFIGGTSSNPVTFEDVPFGAFDFVGARLAVPGSPPDRLIVFRNLDVPVNGMFPVTIDFNASSVAPATANATIVGGANDDLEIFTEVVTARSGRSLLWFDLAPSTTTLRRWAGLPAATMIAGDFHSVVAFATPAREGDFRVTLKYVAQVSDQTLTFGPAMAAPATSVLSPGAYPRIRFQGALAAEYNKGVEIELLSTADAGNSFYIVASSAYLASLGDASRYDLAMPDVRDLVGFPVGARATAGPNDISATAFGFTGPGIFDLTANVGSEYRASTRAATVAVP